MIPQQTSVDLAVHGLLAGETVTITPALPSLVMTIESSVARARSLTLDRSACLVLPAGSSLTLTTPGTASRVAILGFRASLLAAVEREYEALGLDRRRF